MQIVLSYFFSFSSIHREHGGYVMMMMMMRRLRWYYKYCTFVEKPL